VEPPRGGHDLVVSLKIEFFLLVIEDAADALGAMRLFNKK
jgi:dTDP-4-amino-4,6-dideoxygalactose transaminase